MALAALIAAYQLAEDSESLRATLPIGGHALIEHQARQAAQAGARHIVILVERVPAALTAAIDRMRRNGLSVEVARTAADAADRFHPDEALLLIADGVVADQGLVDRLVAARPPALFAVPDDPEHRSFERIDAEARWGGLMLVDGARLRKTVAMLGDWDFQSTLLRRVVQEGALRVTAGSAAEAAGLLMVDHLAAVDVVRERMIAATRGRRGGWPARFLYAPIEELASAPLMRAGVEPFALRCAAIALLLLGAAAFVLGWRWLGLALVLIAGPVDALAARLARLHLQGFAPAQPASIAKLAAQIGVLGCFALDLSRMAGWGAWALAVPAAAFMGALAGEVNILRARLGPAAPRPAWAADGDGLALLILPFAAAGAWTPGLAAAAIYAAVSFFAVQRSNLIAGNAV